MDHCGWTTFAHRNIPHFMLFLPMIEANREYHAVNRALWDILDGQLEMYGEMMPEETWSCLWRATEAWDEQFDDWLPWFRLEC